jgi:hypothetical protein
MVAGVEPGRLPRGDRAAAGQGRDLGQVAQQALRLGVEAGTVSMRSHAVRRIWFSGMSTVNSSCLTQRERQPVMPVQLLALAQPAGAGITGGWPV